MGVATNDPDEGSLGQRLRGAEGPPDDFPPVDLHFGVVALEVEFEELAAIAPVAAVEFDLAGEFQPLGRSSSDRSASGSPGTTITPALRPGRSEPVSSAIPSASAAPDVAVRNTSTRERPE